MKRKLNGYLSPQQIIAYEARRNMSVITNWLNRKLKIIQTNKQRDKYYTPQEAYNNYSWLYVSSCYYDDGSDEFSDSNSKGFHVTAFISSWNGPINVKGITVLDRQIELDSYGRSRGTTYELLIWDPKYVNEIQTQYMALALKEAVTDE